jgi:hypothetical protein
MKFEDYLTSKKIDSGLFRERQPDVWLSWKKEFEQLNLNSFTAQKLYLLNPVRRKYLLKSDNDLTSSPGEESAGSVGKKVPVTARPVVKSAKPIFKPKQKP